MKQQKDGMKQQKEGIRYEYDCEPIILSKPLLDLFLKQENPADLIALYTFYYYTAKWQKTNQLKANSNYTQKGLKWGEKRFIKPKRILRKLGLIEDVFNKDTKTGKINGHYIKLIDFE